VALNTTVKVFVAAGASGMLISTSLFLRMTIETNKALPPEKRIPLIGAREHFFEIKHLHEELFPISKVRTAWFLSLVASPLILGVALIIGISAE